mmetsp:Transcript_32181/g.37517  ORF Transcript_32181/g.37517 Transcript_32181/m.37517 type:complete len:383 (+) Transcript_32181:106-1254(+)
MMCMRTILILGVLNLSVHLTNTFQLSMMSTCSAKSTLYDVPVSNNGARCRLILYKKKISVEEVQIISPFEIGGLKSPEYLTLNPQGKMPLLSTEDMDIPESDTICRYLISTYEDHGPSFLPNDPKSNLIARLHDMYLTTIQGCMYKATPPFGIYGTRSDALAEYQKQLRVIDDLLSDEKSGMYLCGSEVSLADATLFPSMVFVEKCLPKFGVKKALPDKIAKWYEEVRQGDEHFSKVYDEIAGGLNAWEENGRWDSIWLAGLRDEDPQTIFDKIISGEVSSEIVYDDEKIVAFKDINPVAPAHALVIPKDRMGLSGLRKASPDHVEILGRLLVAAGEVAKDKSLGFGDGARFVINDGKEAGQEVPHLHIHVLGGRDFTWPPG